MSPIDPRAKPGAVGLRVADAGRAQAFYERALGLCVLESEHDRLRLGPPGGDVLVELEEQPDAPPRPVGSTGLFHLAILVPGRAELARALRRLLTAGWRLTGASDHLVSEALYLRDPEGNGIEIYRDRPREQWPEANGEIQMATLPLDLEDLAAESTATDAADGGMPTDTLIGHVHLEVADLGASEAFYAGVLGFDVTVRSYPGALFLSAGGYHHHIGVNTWAAASAPPPREVLGLRSFEVVLPEAAEVERIAAAAADSGATPQTEQDGVLVRDPCDNGVLLVG